LALRRGEVQWLTAIKECPIQTPSPLRLISRWNRVPGQAHVPLEEASGCSRVSFCYNSRRCRALALGLGFPFLLVGVSRVLNSVAVGWRLVVRAAACQMAVVLAVALFFLFWGAREAIAAAVGGLGITVGNALAARTALGGGVVPARVALFRLALSVLLKWLVVVSVFVVALAVWRLPPLSMLAGMIAALVAYPLGLNFLRQGKT
jgi:hypothetical protein